MHADREGNFLALDSEGVECAYNTQMITLPFPSKPDCTCGGNGICTSCVLARLGGAEKGSGVPGVAAVHDGGIDVRGASVPRCAVCGGPDEHGNGCEFCPAVGA